MNHTRPLFDKYWAEHLPPLETTLAAAQADDMLELDELWSFVLKKADQRWVGWPCAAARARLSPISSATAPKPVVCTSGDASHAPIRAAARSAISGRRISASLRPTAINRSAKTAVKPTISSAGSIPCASAWRGLFAKPCLFPSPTVFMSLFFGYSFITTIGSASLNSSPLLNIFFIMPKANPYALTIECVALIPPIALCMKVAECS
jgi:hypothetical protein